ncbi:MAG: 6-hydroxymethylpterin diphosphokinase MptE-like protein [Desulfuromonadaceae bacterium]
MKQILLKLSREVYRKNEINFWVFNKRYILSRMQCMYQYLFWYLKNYSELRVTCSNKNIKKGKNAFVLANGPSLSLLDFEKIKNYQSLGYELITVNSFLSKTVQQEVTPDYWVLCDDSYFDESKVHNSAYNFYKDIQIANEKHIKTFVPIKYLNRNLIHNSIYYYSATDIFSNNVTDIMKPLGYYSMTAFFALSIASYLGYDNIFICGYDNDYFTNIISQDDKIYFKDKHFYNEAEEITLRSIEKCGYKNMSDFMYNSFLQFYFLNKFKNSKITNLNKNSFVDTFRYDHCLDVYK